MRSNYPVVKLNVPQIKAHERPLIVDLERTLLRSDPVLEALFAISKRSPTLAFRLLLGSSAGGAGAAAALEQIEDLDAASLP